MSIHKTLTRNAIWNWAGLAASMATGLLVPPFLVHRLGEETYGLWILILSVVIVISLLDFGLRSSIGRHIALHNARDDRESVGSIISTAHAILIVAAIVGLIVTITLQYAFVRIYTIPPDQIAAVRLAVILVGVSVCVTLAMGVYDATLWAFGRFDLINAIEVAHTLILASLTVIVVHQGLSIVALAIALLATTLVREGAKVGACWMLTRYATFPRSRPKWATSKSLVPYAMWNSIWGIGQRMTADGMPMVIGARLNLVSVTAFNVAGRLTIYSRSIVTAAAAVVTPVATALHATNRRETQRQLLMEGSKYAWALALLLVTGLIILGKPFINLWMGPTLAGSARLLTILAIGEALPMSQGIACSMILGMNRHKIFALTTLGEAAAVIGLSAILATTSGLVGVCTAVAACGVISRGVVPLVYACRLLQLPLREYALHVLIPPAAIVVAPACGLAMLVRHRLPTTWLEIFLYGAAFSVAYGALCALMLRREWQPREITDAPGWTASGVAE